jgi:hypothetical protein
MTIIEEVLSFARDYINTPSERTRERDEKIKKAYRSCFNRQLHLGCRDCLIDAIFEIKKQMEKEPCRYRLKPGALLQDYFGNKRPVTDKTLTDELAEYYLSTNPGLAKYFAYIPPKDAELSIVKSFEQMTKADLLAYCTEHFIEDLEAWERLSRPKLIEYINGKE